LVDIQIYVFSEAPRAVHLSLLCAGTFVNLKVPVLGDWERTFKTENL
jgi:hypothetical protein